MVGVTGTVGATAGSASSASGASSTSSGSTGFVTIADVSHYTVTAIAPTATASNSVVTYATTITLDSIPDGLRLGQTANVTVTTKTSAKDALYVPAAAITTANETSTVKVVKSGKTSTVTVTAGIVGDAGFGGGAPGSAPSATPAN